MSIDLSENPCQGLCEARLTRPEYQYLMVCLALPSFACNPLDSFSSMESLSNPASIDIKTLRSKASLYNSIILESLKPLEALRSQSIPQKLAERKRDGNAHLTKAEVTDLLSWKLYV